MNMKRLKLTPVPLIIGLAALYFFNSAQASLDLKPNRNIVPTQTAVAPMPEPEVHGTDNTSVSHRIQVALILDTSNSMDGLIGQAKSQLFTVVNELVKAQRDSTYADVEIALYEYGNDGLSVSSGYVRKVMDFTTSIDDISEKLFALSTNGGSEYCGKVITTSLDQLEWTESDSALKIIYIAGNEGFDQGPVNFREACASATANHTIINTIFCGNYNEGARTGWAEGAKLGNGEYMNIDSDRIVVMRSSPYDDQINQLNMQLNNTYIYYGKKGRSYKLKQETQDKNQGSISLANSVVRAKSKSSRMYDNRTWDLVDAFKNDSTVLNDIDRSTLPDSLKSSSDDELKLAVNKNLNQRSEIQKQINDLYKERETYLAKNIEVGEGETLGQRMVKSMKSQAKHKGFVFKEN